MNKKEKSKIILLFLFCFFLKEKNNTESKTGKKKIANITVFRAKQKNIIPKIKCKEELFFKNKYRFIKLKNIRPLKKKKIAALVFCLNTVVIKTQ